MVKATKAAPLAKQPRDVLTTNATQATACRGRWSQCSGKNQQVRPTWHVCNACTALRETAMKAGFTAPGTKGAKRASAPKAPEPSGLSAAASAKAAPAKAAAPAAPAHSHTPPRTVLSQPVSRVAGSQNAATAQLLKAR